MCFTHPRLIFGGATFGREFATVECVNEVLKTVKSQGITTIDTAALYPTTNVGASERLLGQCGALSDGFSIDTKVLVMSADADGTLEPAAIEKSVNTSLESLKIKDGQKINVLHCHVVDKSTPLEDQAKAFNEQYKKGHFEKV